MRSLLSILLLLVTPGMLSGQTYFYKHAQTVSKSLQRSPGDGTGQFITLVPSGCYDSDKEGYTVNNGFLNFLKTENNIHMYYGESYWGNAFYYFAVDYGRLNVKVESTGEVLVYERTNAFPNAVTSAKIKEQSSHSTVVTPVIPNVFPTPTPSPVPPTPSPSPSPNSRMEKVKCSFCDGTGSSPVPTYVPDYTGKNVSVYCKECGKYADRHFHPKCPSCKGNGYIQKRVN